MLGMIRGRDHTENMERFAAIRVAAIEEEERLRDPALREEFLEQLLAYARRESVTAQATIVTTKPT